MVFYKQELKQGIEAEQQFISKFNKKFNDIGLSCKHCNIKKIFNHFDIDIIHNEKIIARAEIKERTGFNGTIWQYPTIIIQKTKIDKICEYGKKSTFLIFGNKNYEDIAFYFNLMSVTYYPVKNFKRRDRSEGSEVYHIPEQYCFEGWENLQRFLMMLRPAKI